MLSLPGGEAGDQTGKYAGAAVGGKSSTEGEGLTAGTKTDVLVEGAGASEGKIGGAEAALG